MTFVVGIVLGLSRIAYNSLVPAVIWHTAVDVVAGTAGPPYLRRPTAATEGAVY
jgi:hypothetical protein